jgi:4-aminobutyrate aminotransferase-like enzyme
MGEALSHELTGADLPHIVAEPPGPHSRAFAKQLRVVESRNVTYVASDWPVFLARGAGANLEDVDGNRYIDLSAAFAVAAVGHSNPRVAAAIAGQAGILLHAMGDVHPSELKVALARELCEITPGDGEKRVLFGVSGADAVEAALKTAAVATERPGVVCFEGAYHGLTYGALEVTDRDHFRRPFAGQLGGFSHRLPYPTEDNASESLASVERLLAGDQKAGIGALIVEPIQGRGGVRAAPLEWLRGVRRLCSAYGAILITDEIYSGFGRTGRWFACDHAGIAPDLMCVGKGMASGFPISACIGRAEVMDHWPESDGEAIHTSTFLGHPTGCAAALASIAELRDRRLVERAASAETFVRELLDELCRSKSASVSGFRGRGLMWGVQCNSAAVAANAVTCALRRGIIALPCGTKSDVIALSPPLVITDEQLRAAVGELTKSIA